MKHPSSPDQLEEFEQFSPEDKRSTIFHLLYAMDSFEYQTSLESIADNLARGFGYPLTQESTPFQIAQAVIHERDILDAHLKPLLDNWRFERISSCTRLILRLAVWELMQKKIAPNIIINEAIELTKRFAEPDAYKFVNGVLDAFLTKIKTS